MIKVRKVVDNNGTSKISIPRKIIKEVGIEINEEVKVEAVDGKIIISKIAGDK